MKTANIFLLLLLGVSNCQQPSKPVLAGQVNQLVGNASYVAAFGQEPAMATDEDVRVQTHLAYAERTLRQRPVAGLNPKMAQKRLQLLALLHEYWVTGVFPRNHDYPGERRPCFIDRDGKLCAVGYLVAETAGRPVAERVNRAHQYDLIADMRTPELETWVQSSGLTKAECALIQPTYGPPPPTATDVTYYGIGSAVWSGLNVSLGAINAGQFNQPNGSKALAYTGLLSGVGQVAVGVVKLPVRYFGGAWPINSTSATERTFSFLNIGVGTAAAALSAWNLVSHRAAKPERTAVGVVSYPGPAGGTGLSLTRRF